MKELFIEDLKKVKGSGGPKAVHVLPLHDPGLLRGNRLQQLLRHQLIRGLISEALQPAPDLGAGRCLYAL